VHSVCGAADGGKLTPIGRESRFGQF